jgi:peptidoglycan/xylan/chitin deacetylase (PgdA/CDA1 family)
MVRAVVWKGVNWAGNTLLSPPRTVFGHYRNHGPRDDKRIALTFDDGPSRPSSERLLDTLGELGVSATFFAVGSMARHHPDIVERAHRQGHVIGNHSIDHKRKDALAPRGGDHIDEAQDILRGIVGEKPRLYRPPWGWLAPWEARRVTRRGMVSIGWDVYPDDWMVPEVPAAVIAEQIIARVKPGSIVLLHDGRAVDVDCDKTETARAVSIVVDRLRSDGFDFTTVPELLAIDAYERAGGADSQHQPA